MRDIPIIRKEYPFISVQIYVLVISSLRSRNTGSRCTTGSRSVRRRECRPEPAGSRRRALHGSALWYIRWTAGLP